MSKFVEIVYPEPPESAMTHKYEACPSCGGSLRFGSIPCPAGPKQLSQGILVYCAVLHMGWRCKGCGRAFRKKEGDSVEATEDAR